jgi:hypothetical protein
MLRKSASQRHEAVGGKICETEQVHSKSELGSDLSPRIREHEDLASKHTADTMEKRRQLFQWCLAAQLWWGLCTNQQTAESRRRELTQTLHTFLKEVWCKHRHALGAFESPESLPLGEQWMTFLCCIEGVASNGSSPEQLEIAIKAAETCWRAWRIAEERHALLQWCVVARSWWNECINEHAAEPEFTSDFRNLLRQVWIQVSGWNLEANPEDLTLGEQWDMFLVCCETAASDNSTQEALEIAKDTVNVVSCEIIPWLID